MGEPQNPHFYDVGIFGRVQTPHSQNQLFLLLRHQDTWENQETILERFEQILFL